MENKPKVDMKVMLDNPVFAVLKNYFGEDTGCEIIAEILVGEDCYTIIDPVSTNKNHGVFWRKVYGEEGREKQYLWPDRNDIDHYLLAEEAWNAYVHEHKLPFRYIMSDAFTKAATKRTMDYMFELCKVELINEEGEAVFYRPWFEVDIEDKRYCILSPKDSFVSEKSVYCQVTVDKNQKKEYKVIKDEEIVKKIKEAFDKELEKYKDYD